MASRRTGRSPTILQRAVAALARREHSRAELARKLARHGADEADPQTIDRVLDQLQKTGMLSDERFVAALVRRRGERFGAARIAQELRQLGIEPELARRAVAAAKQTELDRARLLRGRRFRDAGCDAAERARQIRFLTARGFSAGVVLRAVKGGLDRRGD